MSSGDCCGCEILCLPCIGIWALFACCARRGPVCPCNPMRLSNRTLKTSTDPELDNYASQVEREMTMQRHTIDTQPDPNAMPVLPEIKNPVMRDRKEGLEGRERRAHRHRSKSRTRLEQDTENSRTTGGEGERSERRDERDREDGRRGEGDNVNRQSHYAEGSGSNPRRERERHQYPPTDYPNDRRSQYRDTLSGQEPQMTLHQPVPSYQPGHRPNQVSLNASLDSGHDTQTSERHRQSQFSKHEGSTEGRGQRGLSPNPFSENDHSQHDRSSAQSHGHERNDYLPNPYPERRGEGHMRSQPSREQVLPPEDAWAGATGRTRANSSHSHRQSRSDNEARRRDENQPAMPSSIPIR